MLSFPTKLKSNNHEPDLTKASGLDTPILEKSNVLVTSIQFIDGVKVSVTLLTSIVNGLIDGAVEIELTVILIAPVLFILTGSETSLYPLTKFEFGSMLLRPIINPSVPMKSRFIALSYVAINPPKWIVDVVEDEPILITIFVNSRPFKLISDTDCETALLILVI